MVGIYLGSNRTYVELKLNSYQKFDEHHEVLIVLM